MVTRCLRWVLRCFAIDYRDQWGILMHLTVMLVLQAKNSYDSGGTRTHSLRISLISN